MEILETIYQEIIGFLGVSQVWEILKTGNYEALRTYEGFTSLIIPIIPLLVILELVLGLIYKKPQTKVYKVNFLIYIFNRFVGRFIAIAMVTLCIGWFQPYAPFQTGPPGTGSSTPISSGSSPTFYTTIGGTRYACSGVSMPRTMRRRT